MERLCNPDAVTHLAVPRAVKRLQIGPVGLPPKQTERVDAAFNMVAQALVTVERHVRSLQAQLLGPDEPAGVKRWRASHPGVYDFEVRPKLTDERRALIEEMIGTGKIAPSGQHESA
jgi:hypothetical protein